jgi:hypothetical protein
VSNSGTIFAGYCEGCGANGISTDDVKWDSSVSNSGTINAGNCDACGGNGIVTDDVKGGSSVSNSGSIDTSCEECDGNGIYIDGNVKWGSSVDNSGTISTDCSYCPSEENGSSDGIFVGDSVYDGSSVNNSGTINANCTECFDGGNGIEVWDSVSNDGSVSNSGTINATCTDCYYGGNGIVVWGGLSDGGSIDNSGTINSSSTGILTGGGGTIVNSGTINADNGIAIDTTYNDDNQCFQGSCIQTCNVKCDDGALNDNVTLTSGSVTNGAVLVGQGDDTVTVGASASYSTTCGNISVTTLSAARVNGLIDGGDDINNGDTLNLTLLNPGAVSDYNYTNFENVNINSLSYSEGPTRLYDDGVVLAFASADGISVCDGPKGLLAGNISFDELKKGQHNFSANGLDVHVEDLGGGQYKVHLLDGGVEQFDDADNNGVADSTFSFGF